MKSMYASLNEIVLTLDDSEDLSQHILASCVNRAKADPNVWSVYLLIDGLVYSRDRIWLQELGFTTIAGNVCENATTLLKLKCPIRTSGETGTRELAVAPPTIPPSDTERAAIARMDTYYSDERVNARIAQIEAESRRPELEPDKTAMLATAALRTQYRREGR